MNSEEDVKPGTPCPSVRPAAWSQAQGCSVPLLSLTPTRRGLGRRKPPHLMISMASSTRDSLSIHASFADVMSATLPLSNRLCRPVTRCGSHCSRNKQVESGAHGFARSISAGKVMEPMRPEFSSTTMIRKVPESCLLSRYWSKGIPSRKDLLIGGGLQIESQRLLLQHRTHSCVIALHEKDIEPAGPSIALLRHADVVGGDVE